MPCFRRYMLCPPYFCKRMFRYAGINTVMELDLSSILVAIAPAARTSRG
jgi:hypothetical protein